MSTPLTSDQAIALLRDPASSYNSPEMLRALAAQVDADSPGHLTVLYSGGLTPDLRTEHIATTMYQTTEGIRIINKSQAAEFLKSRDFLDAVAKTHGLADFRTLTDDSYRGPATDWLYHATEGPWADASARFVAAAPGPIQVIAPNADPSRTFGAVELPKSLANDRVPSIDGIPRQALVNMQAQHGPEALFDAVIARSHAQVSTLRVATNYAGTPLLNEQRQVELDSRVYFKDHSLTPKAPLVLEGTTRDLGALMGPANAHVQAGQARVQALQTEPLAEIGATSGPAKLARNLGHGAAAAAVAYEAADTAHDYNRLRAQGNLTAAQAVVGRSVGTATGAWLGFEAGAALGAPLGPGALATGALGAVAGGVAGDKLADAVEKHRIYTQRGSDGNTWQADPAHPDRGWTRDIPPFPDTPQGQHLKAAPALADELNYKAVAKVTELGLASASARDPFTLQASKTDPFSAYGGDWTRNPDNGGWQRQINYDKPGLGVPQSADPARAAELDTQSRQVIADNAAHSPAAVAATFKALYTQNDWQRHGKLPEAVDETLAHPNRVVGSDGKQYAHEPSGQWTHDGLLWDSHAKGNLRNELNLAVEAQQQQVQRILQPAQSPVRDIPTLETVRVTAPKIERGGPAPSSALTQEDQSRRAEPSSQASAPVTPDFQHDHALLQEREQERQQPRQPEPTTESPPTPQASFLDPSHAGHQAYKALLNGVHTMEFDQGIKPGPHSEKVAAALLIEGVANGLHPNRVKMGADGQVQGIQQFSAFDKPQSVSVDPKQAQGLSMQQYAEKLEATLSSHLVSHAPAAERTTEQKQGIAAMSMNDQILFAHLRRGTPGHISDDHVAQVMLDAKQSGIDDASKIGSMTMAGDKLCVMGTGPGQRAVADVSQQAPALQDTVQQVQAVNQQREQQLALEMQPKPEVPKGHMV